MNFTCAYAEYNNYSDYMPIIKACADIPSYDNTDYHIDNLMLQVLYTHENFKIITDSEPNFISSGSLKMCSSQFIKEALFKAFRINAPSPTPDKLTELGYCENNGYYYYTGGYTNYFATDVRDIVKITPAENGSEIVIFSDIYNENGTEPVAEYSRMTVAKDDFGYYVTSINMGSTLPKAETLTAFPSETKSVWESVGRYLPLSVIIITLALSGTVFYIFVIRR